MWRFGVSYGYVVAQRRCGGSNGDLVSHMDGSMVAQWRCCGSNGYVVVHSFWGISRNDSAAQDHCGKYCKISEKKGSPLLEATTDEKRRRKKFLGISTVF